MAHPSSHRRPFADRIRPRHRWGALASFALASLLLAACDENSATVALHASPQFFTSDDVSDVVIEVAPENGIPLEVSVAPGAFNTGTAQVRLLPDSGEFNASIRLRTRAGDVVAETREPVRIQLDKVADAELSKRCDDDTDCTGAVNVFCDGNETCNADGFCVASAPCGYASCVVGLSCDEDSETCSPQTNAHLDHNQCRRGDGTKQFCHPQQGCLPGIPCNSDEECSDGNSCNGREQCDEGQCTPVDFDELLTSCGALECDEATGAITVVRTDRRVRNNCGAGYVCKETTTPVSGFELYHPTTDPDAGIPDDVILAPGEGVTGLVCLPNECGDGVVAEPEYCDPRRDDDGDVVDAVDDAGVLINNPQCNPDLCARRRCGDGVKDPDEDCDVPDAGPDSVVCTPSCKFPTCGDGYVAANEECDDGNGITTDECLPEIEGREDLSCRINRPNDGYLLERIEDPDSLPFFVQPEECDDGNEVTHDGCHDGRHESWTADCLGEGHQMTSSSLLKTDAPDGVSIDNNGNILIASPAESRVFRLAVDTDLDAIRNNSSDPMVSLVAGSGRYADDGDGDLATEAGFFIPISVEADARGNIYVSDKEANRIRKIDSRGHITTIAGNGERLEAYDGRDAQFSGLSEPLQVTVDQEGNVFFAEISGYRVRRVDAKTGQIDTVFGNRYSNNCEEFEPDDVREDEQLYSWPDHGYTDCRHPDGSDPRGVRFDKVLNVRALKNGDVVVRTTSSWHVYAKDADDGSIITSPLTLNTHPLAGDDDPHLSVTRFYVLHDNGDGTWGHAILGNPQLHDPQFISDYDATHPQPIPLAQAQHRYYLDPMQDPDGFGDAYTIRKGYLHECPSRGWCGEDGRSFYVNDETNLDKKGDLYFHADALETQKFGVDADGNLLFASCKYQNVWRIHLDYDRTGTDFARNAIPELLFDNPDADEAPIEAGDTWTQSAKVDWLDNRCRTRGAIFDDAAVDLTDATIHQPFAVLGHPSGGIIVREMTGEFRWLVGPGGTLFTNADGERIYPLFGTSSAKAPDVNGLLLKIARIFPGTMAINMEEVEGFATGDAEYTDNFASFALPDEGIVSQISTTGRAYVWGDAPTEPTPPAVAGQLYTDATRVDLGGASFLRPTSVAWDTGNNKYVAEAGTDLIRFIAGGNPVKDPGKAPVAGVKPYSAYTVLGQTGRVPVFKEDLTFDEIALNEPSGVWFVPGSCLDDNDVPQHDKCVNTGGWPVCSGSMDECVYCKNSGRCVGREEWKSDGDHEQEQIGVEGDHLLVADTGNHRVLDVDLFVEMGEGSGQYTSTAKTIVGAGANGAPTPGDPLYGTTDGSLGVVAASETKLNRPVSVIVLPGDLLGFDDAEVMLVVDRGNHVINVFLRGLVFSEFTLVNQFGIPGVEGDTDVVNDLDNGDPDDLIPLANARFRHPIGLTIGSFDFFAGNESVVLYVTDHVDRVRALRLDVSAALDVNGSLETVRIGTLRPPDGFLEQYDGDGEALAGAHLNRPQTAVALPLVDNVVNGIEQHEWLVADGSAGVIRRLVRRFDATDGTMRHELQTVMGLPRGERLSTTTTTLPAVEIDRAKDARGLVLLDDNDGHGGFLVSDPVNNVVTYVDTHGAWTPASNACDAGRTPDGNGGCLPWTASVALRGGTSDDTLPTTALSALVEPSALAVGPGLQCSGDDCCAPAVGPSRALFVADRGAHVVWQVPVPDDDDTWSTGWDISGARVVAGTLNQPGFAWLDDDRTASTDMHLTGPDGLLVEGDTLYVADTGNHRVLRVSLTTGCTETVIGTGDATNAGVGTGILPVDTPRNLAHNASGALLVAARDRLRVVGEGAGHIEVGDLHLPTLAAAAHATGDGATGPIAHLGEMCLAHVELNCINDVSSFVEDGVEKLLVFDGCQGIPFEVKASP